MRDQQQVKMNWIPVRDDSGRVRMEARWAPSTSDATA